MRRTRSASAPLLCALVAAALGCGGDIESRMAEVRALQDVGQFTASIDELREILAVAPDLPEANYRLGVALVQTGEPTRAIWALQKASESPDFAVVAGLLLASAHYSTQNYEEAIRAASRVLEKDPERFTALRLRAKAYLGANMLEESLADSKRLVELYPDDYGVRVLYATVLMDLGHTEEARAEHALVKEMGLESDDPDFQARACLAPALFAKDHLKDMEEARRLYEECARMLPTEPAVVGHLMDFFDEVGDPERATKLISEVVEAAPESLSLRASLATRLRNVGDVEGAEKVLLDAVESFGSAAAWNLLANHYRNQGESEKALEAIESILELTGGGSDQTRFTQADILIDLDELDRAEEVAKSIEEPTYTNLTRGRIELARGNAAEALEAFDKGIRSWPNNAGARYLAGLAARELGDYERAISEWRDAVRANNAATDASLLLARVHFARGEYGQALSFANMAMRARQGARRGDALVVAIRALAKRGEFDRARKTAERLAQLPEHRAAAVRELALIEREESGPEAAVAVVEESGLDLTDPARQDLLRILMEGLLEQGKGDAALARLETMLRENPDAAVFHSLRGTMLARAGNDREAGAAFEKAVELDAKHAEAMAGLATLRARAGETQPAIELFDRAAEVEEDAEQSAKYAYSAAQLVLASGDEGAAMQRLREIVRHAPGQAGAHNDLAWLLAEREDDLDRALELAQRAARVDPSPGVFDTLGWVHLKRGEVDEAVEALQTALEGRPESPSVRYHLGVALSEAGNHQQAREMLERALDAGSFPEADAARRVLAQLDTP